MAELSIIGVNHRTAPVEVRERIALAPAEVAQVLRTFHAEPALEESLLISTCNRTELYSLPRPGHDPLAYFLDHIARIKGGPVAAEPSVFYRHDGQAAVRHLFRVAAALDSQIVGEHQILGQVKDAYRAAVEARTAGFLINRLFHCSFRVGKRVQTETELGRGSAGIASAAVELARHIFSTLEGKTALLIGAGQTAECAARSLLAAGATRLIVANRTLSRARQLAYDLVHKPPEAVCGPEGETCVDTGDDGPATCPALLAETGGEAAPAPATEGQPQTEAVGLEDLANVLPRADLVISSTGSPELVLKFDAVADGLRRRDRPLFIVDIAVPRDVDARLAEVENVFLYNIDDLGRLVERNLERRRQEIPRAEAIVEDELGEFAAWQSSLQVAPTIKLLTEFLEGLRQAHVERYGGKFSDADREQLQRFTQTLGNQFIHRPLEYLRRMSENGATGETLATVELVKRLFGLDKPNEK